jgi:hypothetical protein
MTGWQVGSRLIFLAPTRTDGSPVPRVLSVVCVSEQAAKDFVAVVCSWGGEDLTGFASRSTAYFPWEATLWADSAYRPVADTAVMGGYATPQAVSHALRLLVAPPTDREVDLSVPVPAHVS